ncbi:HTH-type transcriptional repressor ComR [Marinomonas aquimarina]|uniref:HTH-type transcriptional repressor ComR n=1 Tax=Marinomonas aquimarina TaxID=295068 RepID=A0A1A8TEZ8_9GAMM|nr:TetR/AcrR family transcriptional regulator [Marinomonas aquimarina]SBS30430.1 HTH-type transcriptional repressor ComR [Marinomonas aquimarina]
MARGRPSKKGLIADAALNLFKVAGYQGTSIDQVVLEAAVSKPTVYSNFPSKLLLWQEVLRQIIARSEQQLVALEHSLKQESADFSYGWVAIWQAWSDADDRLAAYRIHWGEQHKLSAEEQAMFEVLEQHLANTLARWMAYHNVAAEQHFTLFAVSREACLLPAIANRPSDCADLGQLIEQLIKS